MSRVLVSFLGTSSYEEIIYEVPDFGDVRGCKATTPFVQEAILKACVESGWEFQAGDRFVLCVTPQARERNLASFEKRILDLGFRLPVNTVDLEIGDVDKLWPVFDAFLAAVGEAEEVVLDFTHSFRWVPMMASTVLAFLKQSRGVRVQGVLYGAFEPGRELAPVIDLKPLMEMHDWISAVSRFEESGNFGSIEGLTKEYLAPVFQNLGDKEAHLGARRTKGVVRKVSDVMMNLRHCRGGELRENAPGKIESALEDFEALKNSGVRPLMLFAERVEKVVDGLQAPDPTQRALKAVKLCIEFDLVQQGLTILEESITTWVLDQVVGQDKWLEKGCRVAVTRASIRIQSGEEVSLDKIKDLDERETYLAILESGIMEKDLSALIDSVKKARNDINHFGINKDPLPASKFSAQLKKFLNRFEALVNGK